MSDVTLICKIAFVHFVLFVRWALKHPWVGRGLTLSKIRASKQSMQVCLYIYCLYMYIYMCILNTHIRMHTY